MNNCNLFLTRLIIFSVLNVYSINRDEYSAVAWSIYVRKQIKYLTPSQTLLPTHSVLLVNYRLVEKMFWQVTAAFLINI